MSTKTYKNDFEMNTPSSRASNVPKVQLNKPRYHTLTTPDQRLHAREEVRHKDADLMARVLLFQKKQKEARERAAKAEREEILRRFERQEKAMFEKHLRDVERNYEKYVLLEAKRRYRGTSVPTKLVKRTCAKCRRSTHTLKTVIKSTTGANVVTYYCSLHAKQRNTFYETLVADYLMSHDGSM